SKVFIGLGMQTPRYFWENIMILGRNLPKVNESTYLKISEVERIYSLRQTLFSIKFLMSLLVRLSMIKVQSWYLEIKNMMKCLIRTAKQNLLLLIKIMKLLNKQMEKMV